MGTTFHVCIAITPLLRKGDRAIQGILSDDSGRPMSASEVREFLRKERAAGYEYFCGCDNRKPNGMCAGHEKKHDLGLCDWCGDRYPNDLLQNETGAGDAICDECATEQQPND